MADVKDVPHQTVRVFKQFSALIQDELALAKAEMSRNLSRAGVGIALICVAALMALVALNILATALVGVLTALGLALWQAALLIAAGFLIVAAIFGFIGARRMRPDALIPRKTAENIQRDIAEIKEAGHV